MTECQNEQQPLENVPRCMHLDQMWAAINDDRSWVHEADFMSCMQGVIGETYNIGTQKERQVVEVARDIAARFNLDEGQIVKVKDRAFNDQRYGPTVLPCKTFQKRFVRSIASPAMHGCMARDRGGGGGGGVS